MRISFLLFIFLITVFSVKAQIINIPDSNFKNALVNTLCVDIDGDGVVDVDVDANDDGEIQVSEAIGVNNLYINGQNIDSLLGLESFEQLEVLFANNNNVSELDISLNQQLHILQLNYNQLQSFDITQNPGLVLLWLRGSPISSLDLTQTPQMNYLDVRSTGISSLDFSQNQNLQLVKLDMNDFEHLDFSNNPILYVITATNNNSLQTLNVQNGNNFGFIEFNVSNCPNLSCIEVDEPMYCENSSIWIEDANVSYALDCEYLSISEDEDNSKLILVPNPVESMLSLRTALPLDGIYEIYDYQGRKVLIGMAEQQLDVSRLTAGIYFLKILFDGQGVVKKFIKE